MASRFTVRLSWMACITWELGRKRSGYRLKKAVNLAAKGLLRELHVFDVYRGTGVEPGRKSVALGLILQETSRTLTDVEADTVMAAVVALVKGDLKAAIRG